MLDASSSPDETEIQPPPVSDEEILYRSLQTDDESIHLNFYRCSDGRVQISQNAFRDARLQPSLFRHILCENPPWSIPPRFDETNIVATLIAGDIRNIGSIVHPDDGPGKKEYCVDVIPDTSDGQHISHTLVMTTPGVPKNRPFEKLKISLSKIVKPEFPIPLQQSIVDKLKVKC